MIGEETIAMKILSASVTLLVVSGLVAVAGSASTAPRDLNKLEGHRSSLRAIVTMNDGSVRAVTLDGVGCTQSMCSRVKAREEGNSIWLDELASVRGISRNAGAVAATFGFRDGARRRGSIAAANRVLWVHRRFGLTEKIDLGTVSELEFE
jgi:hypothetical protein